MEEYKLHMKKMFQTDFCNVSTTSSVQLKMPDCAYKYSIFSVEIRFGLNHFSTISTAKSKKKLVLVASYEKLIQEKKETWCYISYIILTRKDSCRAWQNRNSSSFASKVGQDPFQGGKQDFGRGVSLVVELKCCLKPYIIPC